MFVLVVCLYNRGFVFATMLRVAHFVPCPLFCEAFFCKAFLMSRTHLVLFNQSVCHASDSTEWQLQKK